MILRFIQTHRFFLIQMAVYVGIVSVLVSRVSDRLENYSSESRDLTLQIHEMKELAAVKDEWEDRVTWMHEEMPRFQSRRQAVMGLFDRISKSIDKNSLILRHREMEAKIASSNLTERLQQTSAAIVVEGRERDIVKWLHTIQEPTFFTSIDSLSLKPANLGLRCEIHVTQWYYEDSTMLQAQVDQY